MRKQKFVVLFNIDSPTIKGANCSVLVEVDENVGYENMLREARREALDMLRESHDLHPEDVVILKVAGDLTHTVKTVFKNLIFGSGFGKPSNG